MRAYTHVGLAHRQRVSTTFLTRKISDEFFLCTWQGSNLGSFGSRVRRSTNWATPSQKKLVPRLQQIVPLSCGYGYLNTVTHIGRFQYFRPERERKMFNKQNVSTRSSFQPTHISQQKLAWCVFVFQCSTPPSKWMREVRWQAAWSICCEFPVRTRALADMLTFAQCVASTASYSTRHRPASTWMVKYLKWPLLRKSAVYPNFGSLVKQSAV